MEKVVIKANKRDVIGKQVRALRRSNLLPAVIYGRHLEPISISLDAHSAGITLAKLSSSSMVIIDVDGKEYATLVREKQRNFIKGNLTHVDFLAVDLNEKIRAKVNIHLVGVSGAVKDYNAVLVHGIASLEIECLPTDLPETVSVDIAALKLVGDGIHVSDIVFPDTVRVLTGGEVMVAIATAPKVDAVEVASAVPGATDAAQPDISVDRGKKDEAGAEKKK